MPAASIDALTDSVFYPPTFTTTTVSDRLAIRSCLFLRRSTVTLSRSISSNTGNGPSTRRASKSKLPCVVS